MLKKLGLQHPFFLPLHRRALTVLALSIWAGLEVWGANTGWAVFAMVLLALCVLEFFILFDPQNYEADDG